LIIQQDDYPRKASWKETQRYITLTISLNREVHDSKLRSHLTNEISAVSVALRSHTQANNSTAVYLSIAGGTAAMTADGNTFLLERTYVNLAPGRDKVYHPWFMGNNELVRIITLCVSLLICYL